MVMNKKFVMDMINYMRENSHLTINEKCNTLGISVPGYYKACKRHGLNGGMREKRSRVNIEVAQKIMDYSRKVKMEAQQQEKEIIDQKESDTLKCNQAQGSLE